MLDGKAQALSDTQIDAKTSLGFASHTVHTAFLQIGCCKGTKAPLPVCSEELCMCCKNTGIATFGRMGSEASWCQLETEPADLLSCLQHKKSAEAPKWASLLS